MTRFRLRLFAMVWLVAQACSFSNAPFFPTYEVELDITDSEATTAEKSIQGLFDRGSVEAVTTQGSCTVQLQLGQCKDGEEIWVMIRALENDPNQRRRCSPSVWDRLKSAERKSLSLAGNPELTRSGEGVYVEVLAGDMQDTDGNGVVDKHTSENRIATRPMTVGRIDIYRATDRQTGENSLEGLRGEFFADIDVEGEGIGFVRGRIDAAVDASDGTPVGPRCHWEYLAEDN